MANIDCHNCKAIMKEIVKTNKWIREFWYWCPECGTLMKEEHDIKLQPDKVWYKPGYLFEYNKEKK